MDDELFGAIEKLSRSRLLLVSGPPAVGKSRFISRIAEEFMAATGGDKVLHDPGARVPLPPRPTSQENSLFEGASRKVFRTVFHQNTKHRDFVTGIAPKIFGLENNQQFMITQGALYKASEFARVTGQASLLIIDELNRGPAVQIFGSALAGLELDKRLDANGNATIDTQYFELLDPQSGEYREYALPRNLYILAAMNQADVSVEPLDVAFLRRWEPFNLAPKSEALRSAYLSMPEKMGQAISSAEAALLEKSVDAWSVVNERIRIGRGPQFQLGHGIFLTELNLSAAAGLTVRELLALGWARLVAHVEEAFFGDILSIAAVLNFDPFSSEGVYSIVEMDFAGTSRMELRRPSNVSADNVEQIIDSVLGY